MSSNVLPDPEELPGLVPGPDSITYRYAGDARILAAAGYALALQVAHPTVAGGVRDHSNYKSDPFGRLFRTLDYTSLMAFGGIEAARVTGERLRKAHQSIKGVDPEGRRYNALEPEAYAWVHATLFDAIVRGHHRFGVRLQPAQISQLYDEWRKMGRIVGVRYKDLPEDLPGFRRYFDSMIDDTLTDNDVVQDVLTSMARPEAPTKTELGRNALRVGLFPAGHALSLATTGLLPARLRKRFGLPWSKARELEFRAMGAASRAMTPVLPRQLANIGPGYLRWRHDDIQRGALGPNADRTPADPVAA